MIKNIIKIIIIFAVGLSGGFFANQILWSQYRLADMPTSIIESKEIIVQENTALQDSILKVEKAIVGIRSKTKSGKVITGSGLIVTSDGLMVTLSELILSKGEFVFFVDSKTPNWQILKRDVKNNLALVKLEANDLMTVSFSDLEELKLGQRVFLVGNIFGATKPLKEINEGVVKFFTSEYIRTNISEKKTLAGSALFNIKGELLGLNTINKGGEVATIPVTKIKDFLGY